MGRIDAMRGAGPPLLVGSRVMLGVLISVTTKEAPVEEQYNGRQPVGTDLHRRRSVIVRMTPAGEQLGWVRIDNDPLALGLAIAKAGPDPEIVQEPTAGIGRSTRWSPPEPGCTWHTRGVKAFTYRRVKNDRRDAADLADLPRMGRLPEAYVASPGRAGAAGTGEAPREPGGVALGAEGSGARRAGQAGAAAADDRPVRRVRDGVAARGTAGRAYRARVDSLVG
jgi:hypothetical protein